MKDIDIWAAELCKIKFSLKETGFPGVYFYDGKWFPDKWTIEDPRCREIVREKLLIHTFYFDRKWRANGSIPMDDLASWCVFGKGTSIKEAEIACITDIYEASK
ncbi:MAG: hypothetical protein KJO69_07455 [Gammaproteobacteria bacterium]|nr:hypothetical protein [Gammaproteobacteria bacterium]